MPERLNIVGRNGMTVPYSVIWQPGETSGLAILLPGAGYTCDMPLFFFSQNLLWNKGYDVVRCEYSSPEPFKAPPEAMPEALLDRVRPIIEMVRTRRYYAHIVLVGKSLGTIAMTHVLGSFGDADVLPVWLTPLLNLEDVHSAIADWPGTQYVAIGTNDPHYRRDVLDELVSRASCHVDVIEGADHGLDVGTDIGGSIDMLRQVIVSIDALIMHPNVHDHA